MTLPNSHWRAGWRLPAGLLTLGMAGCVPAGVPFPERVLDPEVVGVVAEDRQGSSPTSHVYEVEGASVEIVHGTDIELGGGGPGEGRMLVVARDGDTTFYLGMSRSE